jgi:hypothetical protein
MFINDEIQFSTLVNISNLLIIIGDRCFPSDTMGAGFYFLLIEVFPLTDKPAPTKWFTVYIFGACVFIY